MLKQFLFFAAISWTALIFCLCLIQSSALPKVAIVNIDKGVHAFFYFGFTILWFSFFRVQFVEIKKKNLLLFVFLLSTFFGIIIEIAQKFFTTTRNADFLDVMANCTGAVLAILLIDKTNFLKLKF